MPPEIHVDPTRIDWSVTIADQEAIRKINPQRFEMEQLTAVVFMDTENHIVAGYKDIQGDEFWVRGHMPGYPLFPGVLMCEAAAQLCCYYTVTPKVTDAGALIALGGIDEARFLRPAPPGARLVLVGRGLKIHRRMNRFR